MRAGAGAGRIVAQPITRANTGSNNVKMSMCNTPNRLGKLEMKANSGV